MASMLQRAVVNEGLGLKKLVAQRAKLRLALPEICGALADNTVLEELDLSGNDAGLEGAQDMGKAFEFNGTLKTLRLGANMVRGDDLASLHNSNLALTGNRALTVA